ncbi:MAG: hypothetical protein ACFFC1_20590, partial [Promethearchaeota archaeon]
DILQTDYSRVPPIGIDLNKFEKLKKSKTLARQSISGWMIELNDKKEKVIIIYFIPETKEHLNAINSCQDYLKKNEWPSVDKILKQEMFPYQLSFYIDYKYIPDLNPNKISSGNACRGKDISIINSLPPLERCKVANTVILYLEEIGQNIKNITIPSRYGKLEHSESKILVDIREAIERLLSLLSLPHDLDMKEEGIKKIIFIFSDSPLCHYRTVQGFWDSVVLFLEYTTSNDFERRIYDNTLRGRIEGLDYKINELKIYLQKAVHNKMLESHCKHISAKKKDSQNIQDLKPQSTNKKTVKKQT